MNGQLGRVLKEAGELPTTLSELLDEVEKFLGNFVAYPSADAKIAHVLWVLHTHCMDEWESTPRIVFASAEPGSGKSRALEVSEPLVPRPIEAVNATPAYLFRKVSDPDGTPTILYDEIDTVFGPKARDNEEVRGFLNAGHRRGAMAGRCVTHGKTITTEELPAYCAVAMAGLGKLPDTILTRSIVIWMRRRAPNEKVEPYRRRIHSPTGYALRERIETWAKEFQLDGNYPDMPDGVEDRPADVWEPLIAIADAAGDEWSARARKAAVKLIKESQVDAPSLGVRLLGDLRIIFKKADRMFTSTITENLASPNYGLADDAPWAELCGGKPINPRKLAQLLKPYGIKSRKVSINDVKLQGYRREDLWDDWRRYLPPIAESPEPTELAELNRVPKPNSIDSRVPDEVPVVPLESQRVPRNGNGNFALKAAETLEPVPEVPQVPHFEDMDGCPYCAGKGCECCQGPPIEDDYDGPQTGIGL